MSKQLPNYCWNNQQKTEQDILAPPFRRHRLAAHRFGAETSRHWDISAPAVTAPDISALAMYAATLHSDTNNTSGS